MRKLKSFSKLTTARNLLKDLKVINFMNNAKKLKVKKVRAKKEIVETRAEYPSLSENYEEDLERAFNDLNPDNALIDPKEQLLFDKAFNRIIKTIGLIILIIGLIRLILIFI
jgi:hypothetical protein